METSQMYLLISILALLVIILVIFFVRKGKGERISKLGSLGLIFVLAGIVFGDERLLGYSLMGIGILLAVLDIILKTKRIKRK